MAENSEAPVRSDLDITISFLEEVADCDERAVSEFREGLPTAEQRAAFDLVDETCKSVTVALGRLAPDQLAEVKGLAKKAGRVVGVHNVNEALNLSEKMTPRVVIVPVESEKEEESEILP